MMGGGTGGWNGWNEDGSMGRTLMVLIRGMMDDTISEGCSFRGVCDELVPICNNGRHFRLLFCASAIRVWRVDDESKYFIAIADADGKKEKTR